MTKFDSETLNIRRVEYSLTTVYVYISADKRIELFLPEGGTVRNARWVGSEVWVMMSNNWTYIYEGFGGYTRAWCWG